MRNNGHQRSQRNINVTETQQDIIGVTIHEIAIRIRTSHSWAEGSITIWKPIRAPMIECVELTGILNAVAVNIQMAVAMMALNIPHEYLSADTWSSGTIEEPTVLLTFWNDLDTLDTVDILNTVLSVDTVHGITYMMSDERRTEKLAD